MRIHSRQNRPAFSLLEMVLALGIAILLLAGLYQALNSQVQHAQIGRDTISEAEIARSILTRITNDVTNQLGSIDPRTLPVYDTTGSSTTTPSTTTPSTSGAMGSTATGMATTGTAQDSTNFNIGVRGDATRLILSVYRVQPGSTDSSVTTQPTTDGVSDLRQVSYWLVNNGAEPAGLARNEIKQATSPDIDTFPTDLPDQDKFVVAREIKNVLFEYYNGTAWQPTWEGTTLGGPDGTIPQGAPAAIRITITLRTNPPGANPGDNPDAGAVYQHVIALPTANNFAQTQTSP